MFKRFLSLMLVFITALSVITIIPASAKNETEIVDVGYGNSFPIELDSIDVSNGKVPVEITTTTVHEIPEQLIVSEEPVNKDSVDGLVIGYIGDTDDNEVINIKDATNIQKYMAKLIGFSEKQIALSDSDNNGTVNIKDATTIQKHLANYSVNSKLLCVMYITGTHKHNHSITVVEPKCATKGYTLHSCICGDELKKNETDAIGHKYTSKITKATCTEKGYTTYTCSNCHTSYKDNYTEKSEHSYTSKVTKPTCTEKGYTTYTCKNCKHEYKDNYTSASHNYTSKVTKPTCTKEGYTTYTCKNCKYEYKGNYTSKKDHSYTSKVTKPTCTKEGYTKYTCKSCGDSYKANKTAKVSHSFGSNGLCRYCSKSQAKIASDLSKKIDKLSRKGKVFYSGSYLKGEIPAGEYAYICSGNGGGTYYSESDLSGKIIDNENFDSFGYVYVHGAGSVEIRQMIISVDTFDELGVSGAKEIYEILTGNSDYNQSGMYKIGADIPAGSYIIESFGRAYYALLTGPVGNNRIESNDNFNGKKQIYAYEGLYLEISDGYYY